MTQTQVQYKKVVVTLVAWIIAIAIFFPILWTILTSFKTEADAIASPPLFLGFDWTLENYIEVQARSNYFHHFLNSVVISLGSTLLGLLIAIPAAWSMAFSPTRHTKNVLMWMLSTKMLPPVGVLIPIYLLFRDTGLLDTRTGLVIVLTLINLPIIIWMLYTYFKEIPVDILEAARMDGARLWDEIVYVLTPMAVPGIASTLLWNVILAWNEAFWTLNLTAAKAAGSSLLPSIIWAESPGTTVKRKNTSVATPHRVISAKPTFCTANLINLDCRYNDTSPQQFPF